MKVHPAIRILWLACAFAVALWPDTALARKVRTKLPVQKNSESASGKYRSSSQTVIHRDSIGCDFDSIADRISFYGFDKTVTSAFESFFIVNGSDSTVSSISVDISYMDMKDRQLHRRIVSFECDIPPHQTRRQDVRTWDTQKSFFFHQSTKPHRQATPFKVHFSLRSVGFSAPQSPSDKPVVD